MFTKTVLALSAAIVLGSISGAFAASRHSVNPSYDVYKNGKYVGSDPDAFIRGSLARDHQVAN
jgi:hypothetical protein